MAVAQTLRYPEMQRESAAPITLERTLSTMRNPYAIGFSSLIMRYVAVEVAIHVWMPTHLQKVGGSAGWLAAYALTISFVLRAFGRFLGAWLLERLPWTLILAVFSAAIYTCFAGSLAGGVNAGVVLLPLSGLFMSMIYPTLNAKGIRCFPRDEHGAMAGVILFFTACAAALGPLAMAAVSDALGGIEYGLGSQPASPDCSSQGCSPTMGSGAAAAASARPQRAPRA